MGRYIPQLDGLRAVAVLLVIATHTGVIAGGYVGVDVFFVLSGYLITTILLRGREGRGWSLRSFYARRIRRLYPALIAMLLITLPFDGVIVPGTASHRVLVVLLSGTYLANFWNLHPTHWMGGLGHTWSLAVEEQFYLVWPLALPLVLRRRAGVAALVATSVVMLGLLAVGSPVFGRLLFGRGGVILAGCALAFAVRGRTVRHAPLVAVVGAIGLLIVVAAAPEGFDPQAGLASAAVTVPCVMLVGGLLEDGVLAGWLASAPMVWLGRRSYGMYLWHFPIVWALSEGEVGQQHGVALATSVLAMTIVVSAASYRLVEVSFRTPPSVSLATG